MWNKWIMCSPAVCWSSSWSKRHLHVVKTFRRYKLCCPCCALCVLPVQCHISKVIPEQCLRSACEVKSEQWILSESTSSRKQILFTLFVRVPYRFRHEVAIKTLVLRFSFTAVLQFYARYSPRGKRRDDLGLIFLLNLLFIIYLFGVLLLYTLRHDYKLHL